MPISVNVTPGRFEEIDFEFPESSVCSGRAGIRHQLHRKCPDLLLRIGSMLDKVKVVLGLRNPKAADCRHSKSAPSTAWISSVIVFVVRVCAYVCMYVYVGGCYIATMRKLSRLFASE